MQKLFFILIIFCSFGCSEPQKKKAIFQINHELNNYFIDLSKKGFSGAVLIEKNDTIILQNGYGTSNNLKGNKVTSKTVFNTASLGKQFTACAILKLHSENKLDLKKPISEYIRANWPKNLQKVTTHDLLTHTSGITHYDRPASLILNKKQFLDEVFKVQDQTTGREFNYSNTGYEILGVLIEEISGLTYKNYLSEYLFKPLKMKHTGFFGDTIWNKNEIARGRGGVSNRSANDGVQTYGNQGSGNIISTIEDLYKWERSIRNNEILDKKTTKLWLNKHTTAEVDNLFYGYGWRMNDTDRNTDLIWHSGWEDAFNCIYYRFVDENVTIIFLSNYAVGLDPIIRILFPPLRNTELENIIFVDSIQKRSRISSESIKNDLSELIGNYYLDQHSYLEITQNGQMEYLMVKPFGQDLINSIFDYSNKERAVMDSITNLVSKTSGELLLNEGSTINFVKNLGKFDEYNFFDNGNEWVEKILNENLQKYGPLDSISFRGTAHNRSSRYDRTSTEIQLKYRDSTLIYDYINYSGEKYFVPNGTNVFNLFISRTRNKNEFILRDMLKRFSDKVFTFDRQKNNLTISINKNSRMKLQKAVYNNIYKK